VPTRLKRLGSRDVLNCLRHFGFEVVATRGSHSKLRRTTEMGERQTLTVPLHRELATGTLQAVYRQALRFIPEEELRPWFFD